MDEVDSTILQKNVMNITCMHKQSVQATFSYVRGAWLRG